MLQQAISQSRQDDGLYLTQANTAIVNRAVGGASNSHHLSGRAADIRPSNPASLAKFQAWLHLHWFGALGYGARRGFVHLDARKGKGWQSSGEKGARWNY
ncbi:MAG: DUF882 domain-containing protein [Microcystis viridis Mv_BB_P_19951000_S69]|uniref:DUF882 domain-containing protein n=1 Tax=Microcystis viridis Mv_BB_P_19951000_S68D TaxID=2486270 RepID=A0A552HAC5_MICVR|nr:MAG: DUF882 domain-containing protein [Microcystis viridis Mv_BB_P_19951000_S68D]TRU78078.1 MAG: DUF882 domain-containing protein [Microcystis viridis Mv_BB_P_19951000_S69]TRU78440.1 MAG: DUF882 domain-containing protein [Microcystis viridis Mv_BB_P_19951000_S68]TRU85451.1 MAG: DUF882 domain-containing protein [Microcystis viridis Mv_BB_P_19951000_S69D]